MTAFPETIRSALRLAFPVLLAMVMGPLAPLGRLVARDLVLEGKGSTWKYLNTGTPPEGWQHPDFDDSRWKSGPAPLGFGETRLNSDLRVVPPLAKPITVWFRHEFDATDVKPDDRLVLLLCVDDGAVAYLNGREIGRLNLPSSAINATTMAVRALPDSEEGFYHRLRVPRGLIRPGTKNVLAVEVHQASVASGDLFFDAALKTMPTNITSIRQSAFTQEVMKAFNKQHFLGADTEIPDGYIDGGRHMMLEGNSVAAPREILLVDRAKDAALATHRVFARSAEIRALPELERVQRLAAHIDRATTPPGGEQWIGPSIDQITREFVNKPLLLGDVLDQCQSGVCRHRALLFKILADEAGLKTSLVRGNFSKSDTNAFAHAWNEVRLQDGRRVLVDVMHNGGKPLFLDIGDKYVVQHYLREDNTPWYKLKEQARDLGF
jgi:hypothetical protein